MSFFGEIYADPDLPHRARTVYMYLCDRAGGGSCWPGVKTIARDLHLSPRTVQRALNDLERAGYIERQRRHRENGSCTSNLYIMNEEEEDVKDGGEEGGVHLALGGEAEGLQDALGHRAEVVVFKQDRRVLVLGQLLDLDGRAAARLKVAGRAAARYSGT